LVVSRWLVAHFSDLYVKVLVYKISKSWLVGLQVYTDLSVGAVMPSRHCALFDPPDRGAKIQRVSQTFLPSTLIGEGVCASRGQPGHTDKSTSLVIS
jgi:hypothetical protein